MNRLIPLLLVALTMSCSPAVYAYTLTFDDIPAGQSLGYYSSQHGISFSEGFDVADHSESTWGLPHSGTKVLVFHGDAKCSATVTFGANQPYSISSLSAYFSTDAGMVVKALGFRNGLSFPVLDRQIGVLAPDESWSNVYVELSADDGGVIDYVKFEGLNSPDARLGFCADDITVTIAQ